MTEKACLACLRAWPKPEFRQARQQREAQRPESFKRRAFSFWFFFLVGGTKKKKNKTGLKYVLNHIHYPLFTIPEQDK
jgi:hypothetical protein